MPIWVYKCVKCKHEFEFLDLPGRTSEKAACPKCGATTLQNKIGTFAAMSGEGTDEFNFDRESKPDEESSGEQGMGGDMCSSCNQDTCPANNNDF